MTPRPPLDLDAVEALCAATSAGPWRVCGCGKCAQVSHIDSEHGLSFVVACALGIKDENYTCGEGVDDEQRQRNAAFIAAARTLVPQLVAELRALEAVHDAADSFVAWRGTPREAAKFDELEAALDAARGTP